MSDLVTCFPGPHVQYHVIGPVADHVVGYVTGRVKDHMLGHVMA